MHIVDHGDKNDSAVDAIATKVMHNVGIMETRMTMLKMQFHRSHVHYGSLRHE